MTIPDKPLVLDVDVGKLTLGELAIFGVDDDSGFDLKWLNKIRGFLIKRSNWTAAEVNAIEFGEFEGIAPQISEALQAATVPKVS